MKFTPRSTARSRTRFASSTSFGSPQIPLPVSRIAPNPRRFTSRSPPTLNVLAGVLILQRSTAESTPQSSERRFPPSLDAKRHFYCSRPVLNLALQRHQIIVQFPLSQMKPRFHRPQGDLPFRGNLPLTHPFEESEINDLFLGVGQHLNRAV